MSSWSSVASPPPHHRSFRCLWLRVLYTIHIWLSHKILIYHIQRSPIYSTRVNCFLSSLQSKPEYPMCYQTKVSKRSLILILSLQRSFYRLNFWISTSCLSISFKVRLKMVTYFFLRSDLRLYGFTRISYSLHSSL